VVTQLAGESATTPSEPTTAETPTTPLTAEATTEPSTTEPPTTVATTEPTTPSEPTTTEPPTSSTAPPTSSPTTPVLPGGTLAASPSAFATSWNASVEGTQVPPLSEGGTPPTNWTEESVAGVAAYRANLGGNVWLVALAQTPGSPIAQALLIWEPLETSADQPAQNTLYLDAFQALMKTVNNSITATQQKRVTQRLGLTSQQPPFPETTQESATQPPQQYDLFNADPSQPTQPGAATVISVISSQGR
jgi:hypothetical protein